MRHTLRATKKPCNIGKTRLVDRHHRKAAGVASDNADLVSTGKRGRDIIPLGSERI